MLCVEVTDNFSIGMLFTNREHTYVCMCIAYLLIVSTAEIDSFQEVHPPKYQKYRFGIKRFCRKYFTEFYLNYAIGGKHSEPKAKCVR